MQENTSSASESLRAGNRVVGFGIAAIVLILLAAAVFLFINLPDADLAYFPEGTDGFVDTQSRQAGDHQRRPGGRPCRKHRIFIVERQANTGEPHTDTQSPQP